MIFIPGDFPFLLILFAGIAGVTTALIVGAALAAAAGLAHGIKAGVEGNWPWEDPEAWMLDHIRAELGGFAGGVPAVLQGVKGESIQGAIADAQAGTSRGGGIAGAMQSATGQLPALAAEQALQPGNAMSGTQGGTSGGLARLDAANAAEGPSPSDIRNQARKSVGIQTAITAASIAAPYAAGALAPAAAAGTTAAASTAAPAVSSSVSAAAPSIFANVIGGASSTAPAFGAAVAPALAAAAPAATAPTFMQSAMAPIRSAMDATRSSLQVIPNTIGDTASGILQRGIMGAGKGALTNTVSAWANDQDIGEAALRGLASGAASGGVSGAFGAGMQSFAPSSQYQMINSPMPSAISPGWSPDPPSFGFTAGSQLGGPLGSIAGSAVNQMMLPQPPAPPQPTYRRPSYADVYDIGGDQAVYGQARPWWS